MNETDFQRIKEIFSELAELPHNIRDEKLREKCGDDAGLRDEVQSLLDAHDEADNVIENNAISLNSLVESDTATFEGREFGNYKILREIGHGGMGAVFLAARNDGEFNQQVALKIVRHTILDSETERHFRREREILASLNHPNIAHLLDGGVAKTGEAFLVMEYVEGSQLMDFVKERGLSIKERIELFLKICGAVAHAHRNLTIHRDLKPSNILITSDGEPKLLDFGLAKILDDDLPSAERTETLFRAFTPGYASPEQILGRKVTTASDIYSLGVLLFELLTNIKPLSLENKSLEEIIETIKNHEPQAPSAFAATRAANSVLRGDLDNITLRALEREPERRYSSVEAMADDLQRYLDGRPVSARPNTMRYRAAKFLRRHRIGASATAAVLIAAGAGTFVTYRQMDATRRARDRAELRSAEVRQLSNSLLFEIAPKIESLNGSTEVREIVIKRALTYLDSLAGESDGDPKIISELAAAYETIGNLQGNPERPNLSDIKGALTSFEKAVQLRVELPKTSENQEKLAKAYRFLGAVRYVQNDFIGTVDASRKSLEIYRELASNGTITDETRSDYLDASINDAQYLADNNQYKTAIPLFENITAEFFPNDAAPQEVHWRRLKIKLTSYHSNALAWESRQDEAEALISATLPLTEKLLADFPHDSAVLKQAWRTYALAASIYESIENSVAEVHAKRALVIARTAVEIDPNDRQARQNLAKALSRKGAITVLLGKPKDALVDLRESGELFGRLHESDPGNNSYLRDLGRHFIRFGDVYRKLNDRARALENYEKSVEYFERVAAADEKYTLGRRDAAQSLKNVGEMQLALGRPDDARRSFDKVLETLSDLRSKGALGEYDVSMIDEVRQALARL